MVSINRKIAEWIAEPILKWNGIILDKLSDLEAMNIAWDPDIEILPGVIGGLFSQCLIMHQYERSIELGTRFAQSIDTELGKQGLSVKKTRRLHTRKKKIMLAMEVIGKYRLVDDESRLGVPSGLDPVQKERAIGEFFDFIRYYEDPDAGSDFKKKYAESHGLTP